MDPTGGYNFLLTQGGLGVACLFLIGALIYQVKKCDRIEGEARECEREAAKVTKELLRQQLESSAQMREAFVLAAETNRTAAAASAAVADAVRSTNHEMALLRTQSDMRDKNDDLRRIEEAKR